MSETQLLSALETLSDMPIHPYEQAKYRYFGKDYKFPTINDIEVPENFCLETSTKQLSAKNLELMQTITSQTSVLDINPRNEAPIINEDLIKKNILNTEFIKSIPLTDINTNPVEVANKIITFYLNN